MFEKLRLRLFERDLHKRLQKCRHQRASLSLEKARHIGILFEGTELNEREPILAYAQQLKKAGKRVRLMAFMDNTTDNSNFPFSSFNRKDLNWLFIPKAEEVQQFIEEPFDLLLHFALEPKPWMNYISALSAARFRVGSAKALPEACDLMLDMSKGGGMKEFIRQAEQYLKKMHTENELLPA